jgi:hypothetical protein
VIKLNPMWISHSRFSSETGVYRKVSIRQRVKLAVCSLGSSGRADDRSPGPWMHAIPAECDSRVGGIGAREE